jgi:hypothetical protein
MSEPKVVIHEWEDSEGETFRCLGDGEIQWRVSVSDSGEHWETQDAESWAGVGQELAALAAKVERLLALEWLLDQLADLYEPDEVLLWLFSPHRMLRGDRPADRIQQDKIDDVLALVAQLRDGAFA